MRGSLILIRASSTKIWFAIRTTSPFRIPKSTSLTATIMWYTFSRNRTKSHECWSFFNAGIKGVNSLYYQWANISTIWELTPVNDPSFAIMERLGASPVSPKRGILISMSSLPIWTNQNSSARIVIKNSRKNIICKFIWGQAKKILSKLLGALPMITFGRCVKMSS